MGPDGLNLSEDDDVPPQLMKMLGLDLHSHAEQVVGEDNLAAWFEQGITEPMLAEVVAHVHEEHDKRRRERSGGGKGGNRTTRRKTTAGTAGRSKTSSRSGQSSKRTSKGSTASTSRRK